MESIPNEALIHVFSFITRRRDLAHVSLVCRHWNTLAFADLYRTLYLGRQADIDSIAERVLSESESESGAMAPLRISDVMRHLILDPARYGEEDEIEALEELRFFSEQVISKLVHIEHLSWDACPSPQPCTTLAFREYCPELRSIEIAISGVLLSEDGYSSTQLEWLPWSITNIIQASPNLRSLSLTAPTPLFRWDATPWSDNHSSPNSLKVFHDLRTYRIAGFVDPFWSSFFEAPQTNAFHSFLRLHPHLHTVTIALKTKIPGYNDVDPETLAGLFPALRHFEGPAFLCEALVQSPLAPCLETLGIWDKRLRDHESLSRIARKTHHLSELRTLKYVLSQYSSKGNDSLPTMLAAAPKLTHLFVTHITASQLESLPDAIRKTPKLHVLTTSFGSLISPSCSPDDKLRLLLSATKPLADICPRLEHLCDYRFVGRQRCWKIARKDGEAVRLDFDGLRRDSLSYWEIF